MEIVQLFFILGITIQLTSSDPLPIKTCIGQIAHNPNATGLTTAWCHEHQAPEIHLAPVSFKHFVKSCPQYREAINREGLCCDRTTFEYYEAAYKKVRRWGARSKVGCEYNTQLLLCGLFCAPGQFGHIEILETLNACQVCPAGKRLGRLRLYMMDSFAQAWFHSCQPAEVSLMFSISDH